VPPTFGPTFWDDYGYAWPMADDHGYVRSDHVVVLETAIFSIVRERLLWIGTTKTLNPKSLPDLVDDVAEAVRGELVGRDLIPKS